MLQRTLIQLVGERSACLRSDEELLAEVRHLLVGVLVVEADQIRECAHRGVRAGGQVGGDVYLELVLHDGALGAVLGVFEVGAHLGVARDVDLVHNLRTA